MSFLDSLNVFHILLFFSIFSLIFFIVFPVDIDFEISNSLFLGLFFFNMKKVPVFLYLILVCGVFSILGLLLRINIGYILVLSFVISNIILYPVSKIKFNSSELNGGIKDIEIIKKYETKTGVFYDVKILDFNNNLIFDTISEKTFLEINLKKSTLNSIN